MLAVFAEFERDILHERVKAGLASAKLEGRVGGRPRAISGKKSKGFFPKELQRLRLPAFLTSHGLR
jgi:DNA invertase Pin-like site-specific DNA recombinase